jgi:hypothetical protein
MEEGFAWVVNENYSQHLRNEPTYKSKWGTLSGDFEFF